MITIVDAGKTQILVDHHVATLKRLAAEAKRAGCEIYRDDQGAYYVSSRRDPSRLHRTTLCSCTCLGAIHTGHCGHIGMLMIELGALPPDGSDPDPHPPTGDRAPVPMGATLDTFRLIERRLAGIENEGLSRAITYDLITAPASGVDMDHFKPEDEWMAELDLGPAVTAADVVDYLLWQQDMAERAETELVAA